MLLATGAEYRRLPVDGPRPTTRGSASSTPPARPRRTSAAASASASSAAATRPRRRPIWLARGGALVTLLHRRADLRETMSHYLIDELERYGVAVRDRSEIAALHGEDDELEAVTLSDGAAAAASPSSSSSSAPSPCTEWLGDDGRPRRASGFVLTGPEAGAEGLLETSVPGVYAAGDVRAGSIKRCATAVGEGATVVRFVHERLTPAGPAL